MSRYLVERARSGLGGTMSGNRVIALRRQLCQTTRVGQAVAERPLKTISCRSVVRLCPRGRTRTVRDLGTPVEAFRPLTPHPGPSQAVFRNKV